jgi:hypothetical protein
MFTVDEIKSAISELREPDYSELRNWFADLDWEAWDRQIAKDSDSGKLDFLVDEILQEKRQGKLKSL